MMKITPHNQSLGIASVRAYPVKPNYEEIKMMMDSWSDDERKRALSRFRFRKDVSGLIYLYTGTVINDPQKVVSAAGIALRVQNWLDLFEKACFARNTENYSVICSLLRLMTKLIKRFCQKLDACKCCKRPLCDMTFERP